MTASSSASSSPVGVRAAGTVVAGRPPNGPHDAVLGAATAEEAQVRGGRDSPNQCRGRWSVPFTVTGIFRPPASLLEGQDQDGGRRDDRGGWETGDTRRVAGPLRRGGGVELLPGRCWLPTCPSLTPPNASSPTSAARCFVPTARLSLEAAYRIRVLPMLLAALVAALGVGALVHLAAVGLRRRASTIATLAALGFTRRQRRRRRHRGRVGLAGGLASGFRSASPSAGSAGTSLPSGLGSTAAPRTPAVAVLVVVMATAGFGVLVGSAFGAVGRASRPPLDCGRRDDRSRTRLERRAEITMGAVAGYVARAQWRGAGVRSSRSPSPRASPVGWSSPRWPPLGAVPMRSTGS